MHIGTISFCDRVGFNIKSDQVKKDILVQVEEYGMKIIQKHFEKFCEESLPVLNNNPHLICTKTNGNPYLLYLTKYNGINQCIFIDKKVQQGYFYPRMILVKAWFDEDLFNGTLIDGEMVKDKNGKWIFVMNDIVVKSGAYLGTTNLVKRLEILIDIFKTQYMHDPWISYCLFHVKRYFHYEEIGMIITDFIPSLPYTIRGLVFKSLHLKFKDVLMNFDDNLIKKVTRTRFKHLSDFLVDNQDLEKKKQNEPSKHDAPHIEESNVCAKQSEDKNKQVVIQLQEGERIFFCKRTSTPDVYELQTETNDEMHIACVPTLKTSTMLREAMSACNVVDRLRVVCKMHERFNKWMPIRTL